MLLCDNDGRRVAYGKTVHYLLLIAAYHSAQNMMLTTDDGEPLVRCIIGGVMPRKLQEVLRDH